MHFDPSDYVIYETCPHESPPGSHRPGLGRIAWNTRVDPREKDADNRPLYLLVQPSNGSHVAEEDALWLWHLIRYYGDQAAKDVQNLIKYQEPSNA